MATLRWHEVTDAISKLSVSESRGKELAYGERTLEDKISRIITIDNMNLLILGETGTGKTCLARRIHAESKRSQGPLVEVNCYAIPETLLESELFGHIKGAFTDATENRLGKIRAADKGILFLDEIEELNLNVQARLLKVIEDKLVTPVGSERPVPVDIRIIAASNMNIKEMIQKGRFRLDLYERLNNITIVLPPLRNRPTLIGQLTAETIENWNTEHGEKKHLAAGCMEYLESYRWPGNIRELKNIITSACLLCPSAEIPKEYVFSFQESATDSVILPRGGIHLKEILFETEWAYFRTALLESSGNAAQAARSLGLEVHTFRKALRERFQSKLEELIQEGKECHPAEPEAEPVPIGE
jgi:transcriptional regulator with PAS, ATPase and Fis domain